MIHIITSYLLVLIVPVVFGSFFSKSTSKVLLYASALSFTILLPLVVFYINYFFQFDNHIIRLAIFFTAGVALLFHLRKSKYTLLSNDILIGLVLLLPIYINLGDIYTSWDAIASYNRWATDIYNHEYKFTGTPYPPAISSILAYFYILQGNEEIWFTSKFSLIVIPLFSTLVLLYLYKEHQNSIYIVLFLLAYYYFTNQRIVSGEADYPVALLTLLSITLIYSHYVYKINAYFFLSLVISFVSLSVKQAGLFPVLFSIIYGIVNYRLLNFTKSQFFHLFLTVNIVTLFYIYHYINVPQGSSNFNYLQNLSDGKTLIEKLSSLFKPRVDFVVYFFTFYYFIKIIVFNHKLISSFFYWATFISGICGTLLWFNFFGYDGRNSNWAKMYIYFNFAMIISHFYKNKIDSYISSFAALVFNFPFKYFKLIFVIILLFATLFITTTDIYDHQKSKQILIGSDKVSKKVDQLLSGNSNTCLKFISNDLMLEYNYYLTKHKKLLDINAWDVNGVLSQVDLSCSLGAYIHFGNWSKNDPNWSNVVSLLNSGTIVYSDPALNIFYFIPNVKSN